MPPSVISTPTPLSGDPRTSGERRDLARALHAAGMPTAQIARRLGLARATVRRYLTDTPRAPRPTCPSCGGTTSRTHQACRACSSWTHEAATTALRHYFITHNTWPRSSDLTPSYLARHPGPARERFASGTYPTRKVLTRLFGSHHAAIEAARTTPTHTAHKENQD